MFGIGWAEMLVIGLLALIVVGPDKLPEMARAIGKIYHQLRQAASEAGQTFSTEVALLDVEASKVVDGLKKDLPQAVIGHPDLEEIRKTVNPQSLFSDTKVWPAAEAESTAVAFSSESQPRESSPLQSPAPAEVVKDA